MIRLAPVARNSWLILSPIPAAIAIMAVAMAMPRAIASRATLLRRFCRRNDSKRSRRNISVRELPGLPRQVSDADHNSGAVMGRGKRNGVTPTRLAYALGID